MERRSTRKWSNRNITIKVTNTVCGRVDIHKNLSREEISWIEANPNLEVEILEYSMDRRRRAKAQNA